MFTFYYVLHIFFALCDNETPTISLCDMQIVEQFNSVVQFKLVPLYTVSRLHGHSAIFFSSIIMQAFKRTRKHYFIKRPTNELHCIFMKIIWWWLFKQTEAKNWNHIFAEQNVNGKKRYWINLSNDQLFWAKNGFNEPFNRIQFTRKKPIPHRHLIPILRNYNFFLIQIAILNKRLQSAIY